MEPSRDVPWAEHEKLCLLTEIIKASPVSSDALFHFVRAHGIQPRWFDMALPQGTDVSLRHAPPTNVTEQAALSANARLPSRTS
ncbi:uncharacterized protein K452DRAFT_283220 [Aplosporella prunicola CBS 121167]|uniref:Uncharacterized protein n=1 Tax=Aplosporella prunicola CBS 121167 TaxID=1176127 RepID=A0A6A6BQ99_9PEZI|nr:uncharacterized protein K452DRAFT_283220 [Aplosporella prunicola CBS 121167]KAF2145928.1 hypothetical protein K452DRAFT_283220 [Aplosporella prunicola CBS 121167]